MTQCGFMPIYSSPSHTESWSRHEMSNNIISIYIISIFLVVKGNGLNITRSSVILGGGFKHFSFLPLFGEDSHFDEYFSDGLVQPPTSIVLKTCMFGHASPDTIDTVVFSRGILASWLCSGVHGHCAAGGWTRCGFWTLRFWEGLVNPWLEMAFALI